MTELVFYAEPVEIEKVWRRLEQVARPPYVQSWGWVENWLAAQGHRPPLWVIRDAAGEPVAAAFDGQPVLRAPTFPAHGMSTNAYRIVVDHELAVPYVDLDAVRAVEGGYPALLPAPIRAHMLHARHQAGDLEIDTASDAPHAHVLLDELFALARMRDDVFYRRLIDQRAAAGEIQLMRVRSEACTLGVLFKITWRDHVVSQLAAFASTAAADVCHAAAIEHDAARGFAFYELRSRDARLATGETRRVLLRLEPRIEHKLAG